MNIMRTIMFLFFLGGATIVIADGAYISPETQQGSEQFDAKLLEDQYYNECLLTCNQSENINCNDNCKSLAKDKAKSVEAQE